MIINIGGCKDGAKIPPPLNLHTDQLCLGGNSINVFGLVELSFFH